MDDLIAFLTARLDEAEAAAKAWLPPVRLDGSGSWYGEVGESSLGPYSIEHARLHDPARVLREVTALRKLLAEIGKAQAEGDAEDTIVISYYVASDLRGIIAAIWDDHPDYRPEWKPWASLTGADPAVLPVR